MLYRQTVQFAIRSDCVGRPQVELWDGREGPRLALPPHIALTERRLRALGSSTRALLTLERRQVAPLGDLWTSVQQSVCGRTKNQLPYCDAMNNALDELCSDLIGSTRLDSRSGHYCEQKRENFNLNQLGGLELTVQAPSGPAPLSHGMPPRLCAPEMKAPFRRLDRRTFLSDKYYFSALGPPGRPPTLQLV